MTINETALKVLSWAHQRALLRPDCYFPEGPLVAPDFDPPMSAAAVTTLRQKQIRFVGIDQSAPRVVVYLHRATPPDRTLKDFPQTADGFALSFRQGNPDTVSPGNVAELTNTCALHVAASGAIFYTCGSSVSLGNTAAAGTLGCLLRDPVTGDMFALSNNHVIGGCNYAPVGLPIVAPGVLDVSPTNPPPFALGTHATQLPMLMGDPSQVDATCNRDAAVCKVLDPARVSSMQQNFYDTPGTSLPLAAGMQVEKVGRSSERTLGIVQTVVVGPLGVNYNAPTYKFAGNVYFDPLFIVHGVGDRFSEGGDSGSLVTHVDANGVRHAVGIVVAGGADSSAPGQKLSLIAPIEPILNELGLVLVSSHNV